MNYADRLRDAYTQLRYRRDVQNLGLRALLAPYKAERDVPVLPSQREPVESLGDFLRRT